MHLTSKPKNTGSIKNWQQWKGHMDKASVADLKDSTQ